MANQSRLRIDKMHIVILFVFLALSLFSLRSFFYTADPAAFHDLAPMYRFDQLFRPYDSPWDHKSNLGTPSLLTGNAAYNMPLIAFSELFGSVVLGQKLLFVFLMAFSGFGFYLAFNYLFKSKTAGIVAGLYLMFSPFVLARWEYGHNTVLLAYMFLPYAVLSFFKVVKENSKVSMFLCGLLTGVMIYASPQIAYMFLLFALLYTVVDLGYTERKKLRTRILARGVQVGFIIAVALASAFPFFYQLVMVNLPTYTTRAEEAALPALSQDMWGTLISQSTVGIFVIASFFVLWWKGGFSRQYRWWKNESADDSSTLFISAPKKQVAAFALLGFLSVLLVFLAYPPFADLYFWLFNYVPGFGMFREASKFFMLASFACAFFLAIAAQGVQKYLAQVKFSFRWKKALPALLISLLVVAGSWQFLTGDIGGNVGTVNIPDSHQELNSWLSNQDGNFRIAFFPPVHWATTYTWAPREFLNPYTALQIRPTVELKIEQDITKSASFVRWVYSTLYANRTSNWSQLLSLLGVKYVILQTDANENVTQPSLADFCQANTQAAWNTQHGLQLKANFSSVIIYENPNPLPPIYQSKGVAAVAGDRRTLLSLNSFNFNFTQTTPVFIDDNLDSTEQLIAMADQIFFQGDPYWSLIVSFLGENYIVKPWNYAPLSTNPTDKWVRGDLLWNVFNGEPNAAIDGYIYTEGENTITLPLNVAQAGSYSVVVQVYDGLPESQGLNFAVDGSSFIFEPSVSTDGTYRWIELGNFGLNPQSKLEISCLGGPAAVSKIAIIPENEVATTVQNISEALQSSSAQAVYLFDDRSWKHDNRATLANPDANDGRLIDLSKSKAETDFYIFNGGKYTLALTFQNSSDASSVKVYVDGNIWNVTVDASPEEFHELMLESMELSQGRHNITLQAETGTPLFTLATLTHNISTDKSPTNNTAIPVPNYVMISGSEYKINASAGYLTFLEAGDSYWRLISACGAETKPLVIFNYGSIFPIEVSGQYTLRYLGIGYVEQGFFAAIACLGLLGVSLKFLNFKRFDKENMNDAV